VLGGYRTKIEAKKFAFLRIKDLKANWVGREKRPFWGTPRKTLRSKPIGGPIKP